MTPALDEFAARLRDRLPRRPTVVVVGSTAFWHVESAGLCEAIATELALRTDLVIVTGGMPGVAEAFAGAFARRRVQLDADPAVFHLMPRGIDSLATGETLEAGDDFAERRELLGRVGPVYLVIEGGPGTEHEVQVARQHGGVIVPLARTGGHAGVVFPWTLPPPGADPGDWARLADPDAPLEAVARSVRRIVEVVLPTDPWTGRAHGTEPDEQATGSEADSGRSGLPGAGRRNRLSRHFGPIARNGFRRYFRR